MRGLRFGEFADEYDSARPQYPAEAIAWLVEGSQGPVLDLGAGTGKLTRVLVDLGLTVIAVEPDPAMVDVLRARVPEAWALQATAEELPLADGSVDVVLAAQAWHWFDPARAWSSAQRVLSPHGRLAVVWNAPSLRPPWQAELARVGPTISPVTEDWWPPGIPRDAMETRHVVWEERLTPQQICAEHSTHLAVRKLDEVRRAAYLETIMQLATGEAERNRSDTVIFERLTWCARSRRL